MVNPGANGIYLIGPAEVPKCQPKRRRGEQHLFLGPGELGKGRNYGRIGGVATDGGWWEKASRSQGERGEENLPVAKTAFTVGSYFAFFTSSLLILPPKSPALD
jgi:hypothetical protein